MNEPDRLRELMGAYALGHLSGDELRELEAALSADPELRREADELRAVAGLLPLVDEDALDPTDRRAPDGLDEAVLAALAADPAAPESPRTPDEAARDRTDASATHAPSPRTDTRRPAGRGRLRRLRLPLATGALVAVLIVGVLVSDGGPDAGLGVIEPIAFDVTASGLQVDARLVPHTWGTEVFLDLVGTVDGEVYDVELERDDGTEVSAGSFLGDADLEVVCIMNGAVLREDVTAVVVRTADGTEVLRSELDPVGFRSV